MFANHPFAKRTLNAIDENGNEGCGVCGRPRSAHQLAAPSDDQEGKEVLSDA